ncbi:MAG: M67 family metallopeptidase [Deltaproteobacteria bacterium]|nr:M67 family metallopeptidase [Deltaproteobacteria bacterium]
MTALLISPSLLQRIHRQAVREYPQECCGILVGRLGKEKRVEKNFPTKNREHLRGCDRYAIDGRDFLRVDREARKAGREILGFYHSHPDGPSLPSSVDLHRAWNEYSYLIVSVIEGKDPSSRSWVLEPQERSFREERLRIIPRKQFREGSYA